MTEFWKSNKMHWCDVCKCWMNDNRNAIMHHEQGMGHKANLAKKLRDMSKKMDQDKRDAVRLADAHQSIEEKARKQYEEDMKAQQEATGVWTWEEDSKYYYHEKHRWYYDPSTEFYYGGDPATWTKMPAIPEAGCFGVAPHVGGPTPQGPSAAAGPSAESKAATAAAAESSDSNSTAPGTVKHGQFVRRAQAGFSTAAAATAPEGATVVKKVIQLPKHPQMSIGGYQAPVGVGRVGAAKGLGLQGDVPPPKTDGAVTAEDIKRKREAEGKPISDADAEAMARREAARVRVQQRTATQFGYM